MFSSIVEQPSRPVLDEGARLKLPRIGELVVSRPFLESVFGVDAPS